MLLNQKCYLNKDIQIYIDFYFLGIIIVNSQNRIHSVIQTFTWGVHASNVNIFIKYYY